MILICEKVVEVVERECFRMRDPQFLIIDANPSNRSELGKLLRDHGGKADQPVSPAIARKCFSSKQYDCVLMDRDAPPTWRAEVTAALSDFRTSPLIFITGPEDSTAPSFGKMLPADGYVPRQLSSAKLLTEHVRLAVNRIKSSITEPKSTCSTPAPTKHDSPHKEQFADSRIIVHTRRITADSPTEDVVSIRDMGNDRYSILLGDCAGQGRIGDLSYMLLRSRLETHMAECTSPAHLLNELNSELCAAGDAVDFMTSVAVQVDMNRRRMTYAVAGHHPPLHRRWGGRAWQPLSGQDIPLGIRCNEKYHEHTKPLLPGDKVLLISDGFLKIRGALGCIKDGETALQSFDLLPSDAAPSEVLEGIDDLVASVAGGHAVADEITATLIQV
jgi:DNA-binding response OmpR family regulator